MSGIRNGKGTVNKNYAIKALESRRDWLTDAIDIKPDHPSANYWKQEVIALAWAIQICRVWSAGGAIRCESCGKAAA